MQLKEARNSQIPTQVKKKRSHLDLSIKLHQDWNVPCRESTQNTRWLYNTLSLWISQSFKHGLNTITKIWIEVC